MAYMGGNQLLRALSSIRDPLYCAEQDCLKAFQIGVISASNCETVCITTASLRKSRKLTSVSSRRQTKLLDYITERSERKAVPRSHIISEVNGSFRDSSLRWQHDGSTLRTDYYDVDDVNRQVLKEEDTLPSSSSGNVRGEPEGSAQMEGACASLDDSGSISIVSLASAGKVLVKWRQNMEMAWGGAAPDPRPASAARERVHQACITTSMEAGARGTGGDPTPPTSTPASRGLEEGEHSKEGDVSPEETQGGAISAFEDIGGGERRESSGASEEEELDQWDIFRRFWNNSAFVRFRVSLSLANLTMAIPTFLARALPLLAHVRLPQSDSNTTQPCSHFRR